MPVRQHLAAVHPRQGRFFRAPPIRRALARARSGDLEAAHRTWLMLILELWLRAWH